MKKTDKINMIGRKFGSLVVVSEVEERNKHGFILYNCKCECGNEKQILGSSIRDGRTKSCGCLNVKVHSKHGMWKTCEFRIWNSMIFRCSKKSNSSYYKKGIKVCDRWKKSFTNFINDMGPRPSINHSIDRINNNGNYEPNNCRWATSTQQQRNRDINRIITYNGESRCASEWCEILGMSNSTFYNRIKRGWSMQDVIEKPIRQKR